MTVRIPDIFLDLLRGRAYGHLATLMPDGAPQLTPSGSMSSTRPTAMWCSSTARPAASRIAMWRRGRRWRSKIQDPADPFGYLTRRGRVVAVTEDGAAAHLEALSQRYLGKPYPWWQPGEVREIFRIAIDRVRTVEIR
jgi:hypothetical protein